MAYRLPSGSSKQTSAVILNLKESQFLEKNVQTLNLEKAYSSKLKELDIKLVNFYYVRLKNTVSKIHSHLQPEDISALKQLDREGRLKTNHRKVLASNSYVKIEAARRRLGLNENQRRVVSAMPRIHAPSNSDDQAEYTQQDGIKSPLCLDAVKLRRASSAVLSIKLPTPDEGSQAEGKISAFSHNLNRRKSLAPKLIYSCHDAKRLHANGEEVNILENFRSNPYEIRRQNLLATESRLYSHLVNRKEDFVEEVETFVIEHPSITEYHPPGMPGALMNVLGSMLASKRKVRSLESQLDEMRKSRYLRIDDDLIDNSQHITNARQMVDKTKEWRNVSKCKGKSVFASVTL